MKFAVSFAFFTNVTQAQRYVGSWNTEMICDDYKIYLDCQVENNAALAIDPYVQPDCTSIFIDDTYTMEIDMSGTLRGSYNFAFVQQTCSE